MTDAVHFFDDYRNELSTALATVSQLSLNGAVTALRYAYLRGHTVFTCGNGGSASIASHMTCDHSKGIRTGTSVHPKVFSLTSSTELMTAIANDISYADVFSYQLQSYAEDGDVLVAISSSGHSGNIVEALRWAKSNGMRTIALTGFDGGEAKQIAEITIHVEHYDYGVVEDAHQAIMHALAQHIRQMHATT